MELLKYENGILHIRFNEEIDYWYRIPQHVYEEFLNSNNKKVFFITRIESLFEYFKRNPHKIKKGSRSFP